MPRRRKGTSGHRNRYEEEEDGEGGDDGDGQEESHTAARSSGQPQFKRKRMINSPSGEEEPMSGSSSAADQPGTSHASTIHLHDHQNRAEAMDADEGGQSHLTPRSQPPEIRSGLTEWLRRTLGPDSALLESYQENLHLSDISDSEEQQIFATPFIPIRSRRGRRRGRGASALENYRAIDVMETRANSSVIQEPSSSQENDRDDAEQSEVGENEEEGLQESQSQHDITTPRNRYGRPRSRKIPRGGGWTSRNTRENEDSRQITDSESSQSQEGVQIKRRGRPRRQPSGNQSSQENTAPRRNRNRPHTNSENEVTLTERDTELEGGEEVSGNEREEDGNMEDNMNLIGEGEEAQRTRSGRRTNLPRYLADFYDLSDTPAVELRRGRPRASSTRGGTFYPLNYPVSRKGKFLIFWLNNMQISEESVNGYLIKSSYAKYEELKRDNICVYCRAKHFEGKQYNACCYKGQVFPQPPDIMPPLLEDLFFADAATVQEKHDVNQGKFFKKIIPLNTLLSMGSNTYNAVPVGKGGVQTVKAQGSIYHFVSTLLPGENRVPLYSNFYVYDHEEAAIARGESQIAKQSKLDNTLLKKLSKCMEDHNPLVHAFKQLKDLYNEELKAELKIVDVRSFENLKPREHPSCYASKTRSCGDYITCFYDPMKERDTRPRALTIYTEFTGRRIPQLLKSYSCLVDPLCYPLLYIWALGAWIKNKIPRFTLRNDDVPLTFSQRIEWFKEWARQEGIDSSKWRLFEPEPSKRRVTLEELRAKRNKQGNTPEEPEPEETGDEDELICDSDGSEQGDESVEIENDETVVIPVEDQLAYAAEAQADLDDEQEVIEMVERNGELYPTKTIHNIDIDFSMLDEPDLNEPPARTLDADIDFIEQTSESNNGFDVIHLRDRDESEAAEEGEQNREDIGEDGESDGGEEPFQDVEDQEIEEENELERHRRALHGKPRDYVSQREHELFINQERDEMPHVVFKARKLMQLHTLDVWNRILTAKMDAITIHHTIKMKSNKKAFLNAARRAGNNPSFVIGAVTQVPASVPGSPRHQRMHFENAISLSTQIAPPSWFITFTADGNWSEIKKALNSGETWADKPYLVNEVFMKKLHKVLEILQGKVTNRNKMRTRQDGLLGRHLWHVASVEFQQRGLPHAHIILSVTNPPKTAVEVDKYCQAIIPPLPPVDHPMYQHVLRLRNLVEKKMIHSPCEDDPTCYCRDPKAPNLGGPCKKGFPHEFRPDTQLGDRHTAELRRPNNGEKIVIEREGGKRNLIADNRHVVAYNETLLMMFECHCNVIPVATEGVLHYLFKYIYKGPDRAMVELSMPITDSYDPNTSLFTADGHILIPKDAHLHRSVLQQRKAESEKLMKNLGVQQETGQPTMVHINEARILQDMRAGTAQEAAFDIAGYRRYLCSHDVITNYVHMEGEELVYYDQGDEAAAAHELANMETRTQLEAFFKLCRDSHPDNLCHDLTFEDIPKYFHFDNKSKKWIVNKRNLAGKRIGRIGTVNYRNAELYALRILIRNVKGPKSFEDLKTTRVLGNVEHHDTYVQAAKALGLMDGEIEWHMAINETAQLKSPKATRRLFVTIVVFSCPKDVLNLWEQNKKRGVLLDDSNALDDQTLEYIALRHIEHGLSSHGMSLSQFKLPAIPDDNRKEIDEMMINDYVPEEKSQEWYIKEAENMCNNLNSEQEDAFWKIVDSVLNNKPKLFFVHGSGGTGKTYLYTAVYYYLKGMGKNVMCIAHTGIAAHLLPYGQTAHRAFAIPLKFDKELHCQIKHETPIATVLRDIDCLIWDEITMSDKRIVEAVDECLQYITKNNNKLQKFGAKTVVFGGDFKQTLPIVDDLQGREVVQQTLLKSNIWSDIVPLKLSINQRAKGDSNFIEYLEDIGHGRNYVDDDVESMQVKLKDEMLMSSEREMLDYFYDKDKLSIEDCEQLAQLPVILTPDNATSLELNEKILDMLDSEEKAYVSIDKPISTLGCNVCNPESFRNITPSGLPRSILRLKKNSIVILLTNLAVSQGLCNGTRLRVLELKENVVICEPLHKGFNTVEKIAIPRTWMTPANQKKSEFSFSRLQLPLRLAYSMTVNKAQGQTLPRVGIILRSACFTHGQLYVALSRAKRMTDVKVVNHNQEHPDQTTNHVFKEVLF